MAYNRGDDLQERIKHLSHMLFGVKVLKFFFFFYSFISFFFWFLNCFELDWLYLFSWVFIIPYKIVGIFYKPTGISADFSLAIIGIIFLILGFLMEMVSGNLYKKIFDLQENLERYIQQKKTSKSRRQRPMPVDNNQNTAAAAVAEESIALIFIIQPHVHKIRLKPTDLELTFQDVEIWRQRVNKRILENIKYSQPSQKGYYRKNLFLVYKDFNYIDDFIYYIKPTVTSIVMEFKKYGIDVQFNYVLSALAQMSELEKELDLMDTILSLNFVNTFILTNRFKKAYEVKAVKKYSMKLKGEYNLSKNLSISNLQALFVFKDSMEQKEGNINENENNKNEA